MTIKTLSLARKMVYLEAQARAAEAVHDQVRAEEMWKSRERLATYRSALLRQCSVDERK